MSNYQASFKSFNVKISMLDKEKILNESMWPNGIQCKMWKNPRRSNNDNVNVNNDQYGQRDNHY